MGGVSGGGIDAGLCDRVGLLLTLLARGHYRHMVSKDILSFTLMVEPYIRNIKIQN